MNIVILTGNYLPTPSPNGNIAKIIAEQLSIEGDNVYVICFDKGFIPLSDSSIKPVPITTLHRRLRYYFIEKNIPLGVKITSLYRVGYRLITGRTQESWYIKKALNSLKKINNEEEIDLIISLNNPIEAHISAIKFKEEFGTKVITYWLDQYSDASKIHKYSLFKEKNYNNNILKEKWIHNSSNLNLITENRVEWIKNYIGQNNYSITKYPLITKKNYSNNSNSNQINITYAGSFYKNLREPLQLLSFFEKLNEQNVYLNVYAKGDCEETLNQFRDTKNINIFSVKSKEEIIEIYTQSNILINIGNSNPTQMPSKLYEYIDMGVPILNFYYSNDYEDVLRDYPYHLSIPYERLNEYEGQIIDFINKYSKMRLSKKNILSYYYEATPEYVVSKIKGNYLKNK
ncbi:hypothetical protein [Salinicoccus bachuensis]|uniref:Glycosyltransferase involved in cell wall biosynthesis n=1 Tax=Salinicoccus bachuensis TaxID=3136731 RepID=A0ABZ3CLN4_9STAP